MRSSRGRWSLYQILKANEKIEPFLLKTELLNEESLNQNLHHHLVIKPCFGSTSISVSSITGGDEQYRIYNGSSSTMINGKMEVFNYLNEVCKEERFYILQDLNFLSNNDRAIESLYVTIQQGPDSNWSVVAASEKNGLLDQWEISLFRKKYHDLFIEIARCLKPHFPSCLTFVLDIGVRKENLWIQDISLHFSKSKWSQYQILDSLKELSPYLPHTELVTPMIFFDLIEKYKHVILKPCLGQWGLGVVQVSLLDGDVFEVHNERKKLTITGRKEIIDHLLQHYFSKDTYIVQARIKLATIEDCVFDTRVMVQRDDRTSEWEITAKVVKVASKNFIVTNVARAVIPLEEALENSSICHLSPNQLLTKMDEVSMLSAMHLGEHFKDITTIGMDVGIDDRGDIWVFETNLVPDISLFRRLKDKSIYQKVLSKGRKKNKGDRPDLPFP
jgi:YheC/D like ATP-grasp